MKPVILLLATIFFVMHAAAQCNAIINNFPYSEGFEISGGNWVSGGVGSDWAWGIPTKPVIKNAAAGSKCWITGGTTKSQYNDVEYGWLRSPCFDFSNLQHPFISFNVFWETERKYDGALLQYSTNNGSTWQTLGSSGEISNCLNANWYNNNDVVYLGDVNGWSGNIQPDNGNCLGGGGSGSWLKAQHDMLFLAGASNVVFRFLFASGTTCNDYDGFAVDDIFIGEAPKNVVDFSYQCNGNFEVAFTSESSLCAQKYFWDFGDAASAFNNTSSLQNTTHSFTSAGTYAVSLKVIDSNNDTSSVIKNINIIEASITQTAEVLCNGDNTASAAVNIGGSQGPFIYEWNTTPVQTTGEAQNLPAGSYTVVVKKDDGTCPATASIIITEPTKVVATIITKQPVCTNQNGSITLNTSGGVAPYNYLWQPLANNTNAITNLGGGNYSYSITDKNNCTLNGTATLSAVNDLHISLGNDTTICPGDKIILFPGNFNNYLWQDNSTGLNYTVIKGGNYAVTVTDLNGCTASSSVSIEEDCGEIFFPTAFTPNGDNVNDGFGPLGNRNAMANYSLHVYNRWGQLVFESTDPFAKWYGASTKKSTTMNNVFVWIAKFDYRDKKNITRKGTVLALY